MKKTICPFLGLREDPGTALHFPSEGNACHRASPIAPVDTAHQEQFCLGPGYKACPIYLAAGAQPVAAMFAAPSFWKDRRKRRLAVIAIPFVAAGVVVLGITFNGLAARLGLLSLGADRIPQTGASNQASALGLFGEHAQPAPLLFGSPTASLTPAPKPICAHPEGWVPYTVNPTDSLFRLSSVYGIPVDVLQQGNCMGKDTVILPGQVIYVPFMPSPTPSATPTPTLAPPTETNTTVSNAAPPANQAQDKPAPPPSATPLPPQKPVISTVPPSKPAQPPAAKPPDVKPTEKPKPPQVKPTEKPKPPEQPKPGKTDKPKDGGGHNGGKGGGGGGKGGGGKKH